MKPVLLTILLIITIHINAVSQTNTVDTTKATSPDSTKGTANQSATGNNTKPNSPALPIKFSSQSKEITNEIRYGTPFSATIKIPEIKNANGKLVPITLTQDNILLVINNRQFTEYPAQQILFNERKDSASITFNIDHHSAEGTNLAKFLGSERSKKQKVNINLALRDGTKITSKSTPLTVIFYEGGQLTLIIIVAIFLTIGLLILANKTTILKDKVDPLAVATLKASLVASGAPNPQVSDYRWSLGKTQLAIWTLSIAILFLLIWIISEGIPSINTTVLALLGISFGTTAAASLQESVKTDIAIQNSNFLRDLIDDGTGPSIHRFQNVVFLIVFFCIFIGSTFRALEFPEFDTTQLLLLGISSAGYVGMKFLKEGK